MALSTIYKVEVDWDNDRLFANANSNVSADLISLPLVKWGRNYDSMVYGRSIAGSMDVVVDNADSKYSNFENTSALFGLIRPHRRIRFLMDPTEGGTYTPVWEGWLDQVIPEVRRSGFHRATFKCKGIMVDFTTEKVYAPMQTSILTGVAANKIADAVGIPKLYADQAGDDGPVGYWRFGESSGNAIDDSGNGNDGTVTSVTYSATALLGDDPGTSYEYDGTASVVEIAGAATEIDDKFAAGASLEWWGIADSDGEGSLGRIFHKASSTTGSDGFQLYVALESGGVMEVNFTHDFSTTRGTWRSPSDAITAGAVHHGVLTYDGSDVGNAPILYINGVALVMTETSTPVGTISVDNGQNLFIGNAHTPTRTWDGHLQEAAIYDVILTPSQVRQHHIAGRQRYRDIDDGETTMDRWWSPGNQFGHNAMRKVEEVEFGFFRETKTGKARFAGRNDRLTGDKLVSQATYRDTTSAIPYANTSPSEPTKDIANIVRVPVNAFTTAAAAVLWTLQETPSLAVGESRSFRADYPQPDSPPEDIGVDPWTTPVATTDYTGNTQADGLGTDRTASLGVVVVKSATSMLITITNNHATDTIYITLLQARGAAVSKSNPVTIEVFNQDSIDDYGQRAYLVPAEFIQDSGDAKDYADFVLQLQKDPHPKGSVTYQANISSAALADAAARDVSDRVTYVADGAAGQGINEECYVESITMSIDERMVHTVTLTISPAEVLSTVIILDTGPGLDTGILGR